MPSSLIIHFIFLTFFFTIVAQAQVPTTNLQTFKFVNHGAFEDQFVEHGASYRCVTGNNTTTLNTFPFNVCFYNTTPGVYTLAIRLGTPQDEGIMRHVWHANNPINNPVHENATLTLNRNGNLVLADFNGRIAWQSYTTNKGVTGIKLRPNGNLILEGKNGMLIWQSFDHPTDTLLLGQFLQINGANKIVSRAESGTDVSNDGKYVFTLDDKGINLYMKISDKLFSYGGIKFNNTDGSIGNLSLQAQPEFNTDKGYAVILAINQQTPPLPSMGQLNLGQLNYNATYSFIRIESDGNLRLYTYYDQVMYNRWEKSFSWFRKPFAEECGLPSKCGEFGLCSKGMCVACPSPKGLSGWSESCTSPKLALATCSSGGGGGKVVDYYKIVGVDHFLSVGLDGGSGPMKVEECRKRCDEDCKCLGYFYKEDTSKCLLAPLLGTLMKVANSTSVGYIKYSK